MSAGTSIILIGSPSSIRDQIANDLLAAGHGFHCFDESSEALELVPCSQPRLVLLMFGMSGQDDFEFCRLCKANPELAPYILLMIPCEARGTLNDFSIDADDFFFLPCSALELDLRLRCGMRFLDAQRELGQARLEIAINQAQAEQNSVSLQDNTMELVEMAAELQSEINRNNVLSLQHIHTAKTDTISQAAATLRHEINNPLFAICGSAESALKRLRMLAEEGHPEGQNLISRLERVLLGAERIRQVVQAFSTTVDPATRDYLPGMPMLELQPTGSEW